MAKPIEILCNLEIINFWIMSIQSFTDFLSLEKKYADNTVLGFALIPQGIEDGLEILILTFLNMLIKTLRIAINMIVKTLLYTDMQIFY